MGVAVTPDQQRKERAVGLAILMDVAMLTAMLTSSLIGGSFTMLAEFIRAGLGFLLECFSYVVLRRIHRGVLADLDYGTGKLEQVANLLIGAGMLFGAAWIVVGALRILAGSRDLGTPFGLALAAMVGIVNLWVNLVAWDGVRRAAAAGDSLIMQAQLTLRWTKLFSSAVVVSGLTVAALSTDDVIVAWADSLGSFFVAGYLAWSAQAVLREALPDLLDRSAGEVILHAVDAGLARHADDYVQLQRVRSRRAGHTAFVEIALEFDAGLSVAEVDRRIEALKASIVAGGANVDVAVVTRAAPSRPS